MVVDTNGDIFIITQENTSINTLRNGIEKDYDTFKANHIIVNLANNKEVTIDNILMFIEISNIHRSHNNSFVIVADQVDLDQMPDEIVVVPTLQEAYDIIEMEDIERDLGF